MPLRLGSRTFPDSALLVMAVVNRTPDSFYDRGATYSPDAAYAAVERAVADRSRHRRHRRGQGRSRPARSTPTRRSAGWCRSSPRSAAAIPAW